VIVNSTAKYPNQLNKKMPTEPIEIIKFDEEKFKERIIEELLRNKGEK
jgi:hypothetical protein